MWKFLWSAAVLLLLLVVAIPLVIHLVNVLLVPAAIAVALYVAVRVTNARLNRW